MKHFITFQKRKGLYLVPGISQNQSIAYRIQAELMKYGFVLSKELFDTLSTQSEETLSEVYQDLCKGLREIIGTDGYEPIYRNFPQSVQNLSYEEFVINAIMHYWSFGAWRPEDEGYLQREFKLEPVNYKEVRLLTEAQFNAIFTDIVYSGSSISKWDKKIVDYFIDNALAPELEFNRITFKETKAYIGKRYLETGQPLPLKSSVDVLRVYAAFCGGDEGLKEKTKFKQPKRGIKNALLKTLNGCYDLEESFKSYREPWLKVLYYLNPGTTENQVKYPELSKFARLLRNSPEKLRTFNSYLEGFLKDKNPEVFNLLKKRKGVFMRRMNELFSIFGMEAIDEYLKLNPTFEQLVTLYNYFSDRAESKDRAVVLANQERSTMTTFGKLEALNPKTVERIQLKLMNAIVMRVKKTDKKVFIDRGLYYSPLATNNRASSFSMTGAVIGKVEKLPDAKIIRCYVHWVGKSDIDLSAFVIDRDMNVTKVGWNGQHTFGKAITYSGDNTGYSAKNAEYLDIDVKETDAKNVEWIVVDARVYRGNHFGKWGGEGVLAGWMSRKHPESNQHWLPETVEHAIKLQSDANNAYLMAVHVPSNSLVYLDVALGTNNIIASSSDALKMKVFLEKFVILDDGSVEVKWDKLAQGHVLNLLSNGLVDKKEDAELVFDENTPWETVAKALTEEVL